MWEIFSQLTFSTARKVLVSFSQLKKDFWPFFQIFASFGYFNHVRNIFSHEILNWKKDSMADFLLKKWVNRYSQPKLNIAPQILLPDAPSLVGEKVKKWTEMRKENLLRETLSYRALHYFFSVAWIVLKRPWLVMRVLMRPLSWPKAAMDGGE